MYHYLSVPPRGADAIRRDLSITPALFETHLAYLREAGYETISLEELSYAFIQQASLPPKPIILTFDDGYRDNYENAFPLLKKYNYHATFFLMTQPVDTYNVNYMTWEMIQEMSQAGMEFGSHTHTHPDLRNRSREFLSTQLVHSQELIEAHLGKPVRFFCYPSGQYDSLVIETLQAADYWAAVTTQPGSEHSFGRRYEMARLRISGGYTAADLAALLE
jgi:peptidoglycan/xylan/chitin deacetylase (PgdA/CDA1 family)